MKLREKFNLASKTIGRYSFDKLKLVEQTKENKTGQYATGEEVLSYLANDNEMYAIF
jgi:DNA polymerase-1